MQEILNGIRCGNIFVDENQVIFTSQEAFTGFTTCLSNVLGLIAEDMSKILNIPSWKIVSDYLSESGSNIMEESLEAALKRQYEKEGKVYKRPETLTRAAINRLLSDKEGDI